jgi:hypothetical protein
MGENGLLYDLKRDSGMLVSCNKMDPKSISRENKG